MATNLFLASVYKVVLSSGSGDYNPYQTIAFPATGGAIMVTPAPSGTTSNGVTLNSIITVLPTGLVVPPGKYYSDRTVAQIQTLANA